MNTQHDTLVIRPGMADYLDRWCAQYEELERMPLSGTQAEHEERLHAHARLLGAASAFMHDMRAAVRRGEQPGELNGPPPGFQAFQPAGEHPFAAPARIGQGHDL